MSNIVSLTSRTSLFQPVPDTHRELVAQDWFSDIVDDWVTVANCSTKRPDGTCCTWNLIICG